MAESKVPSVWQRLEQLAEIGREVDAGDAGASDLLALLLTREWNGVTVGWRIVSRINGLLADKIGDAEKEATLREQGYLYTSADCAYLGNQLARQRQDEPTEFEMTEPRRKVFAWDDPPHVLAFAKAPVWDLWKDASVETKAELEREGYWSDAAALEREEALAEAREVTQVEAEEVVAKVQAELEARPAPEKASAFDEQMGGREALEAQARRQLAQAVHDHGQRGSGDGSPCYFCGDAVKGSARFLVHGGGKLLTHPDCIWEVLYPAELAQKRDASAEGLALARRAWQRLTQTGGRGRTYKIREGLKSYAQCPLCAQIVAAGQEGVKAKLDGHREHVLHFDCVTQRLGEDRLGAPRRAKAFWQEAA